MRFLMIWLILANIIYSQSKLDQEIDPIEEFPKHFKKGLLRWGVDCEHFEFKSNGTFSYKFTGDCKGWGRTIKGTWKKGKDRLIFQANMHEGPSEEEKHCGGSYYHTNTKTEKKNCIKKYKKMILDNYHVYPALLDVKGFIILDDKNKAFVTLKSTVLNSPSLKDKAGMLQIEGDSFGEFDGHSL